jgi:hypothetical protein
MPLIVAVDQIRKHHIKGVLRVFGRHRAGLHKGICQADDSVVVFVVGDVADA